ncbi:protein FAM114A2 [Vanessa atalanta]|uniref:protein FAM114A2 n=1 Tax=Vanessa atalanta TaxID=42275 RepID=UPI001FCE1E43|nr:protein FAM114A2 [Vanessa atalanta]
MPSSDSEDFESADEGHSSPNKKERKKRLSSSNYSDNLELDHEPQKHQDQHSTTLKESTKKQAKPEDGWDDFDIDEEATETVTEQKESHTSKQESTAKTQSGWDDFDEWGDSNVIEESQETMKHQKREVPRPVTDHPAPQPKSEGWGWGWGVDSLLSTATAGISNLTTQVSQGISTVLETGIGAPDPEELARISVKNNDSKPKSAESEEIENTEAKSDQNVNDGAFQFGSLFSGVTKFVETTGTKVIAGGLDTLETIGKKTMEVLQDGDPGLAKKRAMLGLDSGDKLVLSQVLREAKAKADEEDLMREAKREAKEVHYETLFDDFEGLVHLEALEMLSKQVSMRIDERLRNAAPDKRHDIKETLQQVAELCEMPEEEDDEEEQEEISEDISKPDAFHERLQRATRDIGLKLQFQPLIKQYTEILTWFEETETDIAGKAIYKRAVSGLAQTTALCVELYHKTAEMLLVKNRRSTADEADALTQMTVVLTRHISDLATQFTEKLSGHPSESKEQINGYITNVFLEAGNSSKYIENAFQLTLPIIQIGAV